MASLASINIKFQADMLGFSKEMQNVSREIDKASRQMQDLGKSMSMYLTLPIVAFGAASVLAFDESDKAIASVNAGLKSTGGIVGFNSEQLQKMAADLQKVTTFDDDSILKNATATLLTFDKITGKTFADAQKAALDLSTKFGGDLQASAVQLGKALNSPVDGITALKRVGISFSDGQKATIKAMVETNNIAGAQGVILKELAKEVGGSAEAAAKAGLGPFQILKNQLNDLQEDIGKIIVEALKPLAVEFGNMVSYFQALSPEAKKVIVIIGAIVAAVGPLLVVIGTIGTAIPFIITGFAALSSAIVPVVAVVGLLVGAFILFKGEAKEATSAKESLNNAIQKGNKAAGDEIVTLDKLYASATSVKSSTDERKEAINKLQELYPAYFKNLDTENFKNGQAKDIYNQLRDAIFNKARAIAVENELQNRANERIQQELKLRDDVSKTEAEINRLRKSGADFIVKGSREEKTNDVVIKNIDLIKAQYKLLKEQNEAVLKFNEDAKNSDKTLLDAKQEFDTKSSGLAKNETERQNEIIRLQKLAADAEADKARIALYGKEGTIKFYDKQIEGLKGLQKEIPTTNSAWKKYEDQITAIQTKIDAIEGKGPIKLPKPKVESLGDNNAPEAPTFSLQDLKGQEAYYTKLREEYSSTSTEYDKLTQNINNTQIKIKAIEGKDEFISSLDELKTKSEEFNKTVSASFDKLKADIVASFAQTIGNLMTSSGSMDGFFTATLKLIGGFLSQMGKALILYGTAGAAFKLGISNPYVAMAAGVALVVVGTAIGNMGQEGPKTAGAFADGGIVGGQSYYGDKILARVNSGELILNTQQQSRLHSMITPASNFGSAVNVTIGGGFEIDGTKLRLVLDRTDNRNNRTR